MDPLVFEPYVRPQIWGGRRLGEFLGKPLPASGTFGESWEISGHPHHVSRVAEGLFRGQLLTELCRDHAAELFGNQVPADGRFPLLVKFLDCHDRLSVQVHPSDELAARLLPGEAGKTEAWVVLEAGPAAKIFAGLVPGTTRQDLERHLELGTVDRCLHAFTPRPGDCVFLPAGTVHAVGGGVVLAEVQQTSDATFRLFDWNRVGPDGKPRQLHVREALAAIDWERGPVLPQPGTPLSGLPEGIQGERLVDCRYFTMDRFILRGPFPLRPGRWSLWMVLDGSPELIARHYRRAFRRGETVLVPARASGVSWMAGGGPATLLGAGVPENGLTP